MMGYIDKIKRTVKKPLWLFVWLNNRGFVTLNDQFYIKLLYKLKIGKKLNLENPKTFNEKLQWLKLNDRKDIYTIMVDKYEAKRYVAKLIGEQYIIPTIGVYDKFLDINFSKLPDTFVMKCTHDSGGVIICDDKSKKHFKNIRKIISKYLKRNYYVTGREWPYKNVKPRIIIEKYMGKNISDYKVHCFNGKAKIILVCTDREVDLKETFFDRRWNVLPFKRPDHDVSIDVARPSNLALMINLAEKLSKNIPFLRVDFYEVNGKTFFGELTFYPASGFEKFVPGDWDRRLGDMIDLSIVKQDEK